MGLSGAPVKANSLSPMNIAASYWCLFNASCRQLLRNSSIFGFAETLVWFPRFRLVVAVSSATDGAVEGSIVKQYSDC
jgi:hypothetical protein